MNRRTVYGLIALVTMVVGLVWRFVLIGMPPGLYKYGGSVLWAAMIYLLAALVRPDARPVRLALGRSGDYDVGGAVQAGAHAGA